MSSPFVPSAVLLPVLFYGPKREHDSDYQTFSKTSGFSPVEIRRIWKVEDLYGRKDTVIFHNRSLVDPHIISYAKQHNIDIVQL